MKRKSSIGFRFISTIVLGVYMVYGIMGLMGCTTSKTTPVITEETSITKVTDISTEDQKVKSIIESIWTVVTDQHIVNADLDKVLCNKNLSDEYKDKDTYLAMVYFNLKPMTRDTGNKIMQRQSNIIVEKFAETNKVALSEITVFWEDLHNSRTVKYTFEFKDGAFYLVDTVGE